MTLLVLLAARAHAGSCCLPSTTALPLVLGGCERWGAGLTLGGTERLGGWAWDGRMLSEDSYDRHAASLAVAGLARVAGPVQVGVSVPFGVAAVRAGADTEVAAGPGDLSAQVLVLPAWTEGARLRPSFGLDATVPLGATEPGALATVRAEAWSVGASAALELNHGDGAVALAVGGQYAPPSASLSGTVALTEALRLRPWLDGTGTLGVALTPTSVRPELGLGAILRPSPAARATVRVDLAPPIGGIGRSADAEVRVSAALLVVYPSQP
jgi:hypothetical protein